MRNGTVKIGYVVLASAAISACLEIQIFFFFKY